MEKTVRAMQSDQSDHIEESPKLLPRYKLCHLPADSTTQDVDMGFFRFLKDSGNNPAIVGDICFTVGADPCYISSFFHTGVFSITERATINVHHSVWLSRI